MNAASRAATRSRAALEFRLLGPVDVVRDGQALAVGGPRQLSLLTMLLLQRDRVVSTDRLVEDLWAGAPSAGARTTIRSYASRVRALLDCDPGVTLCSRAGGYVLTCDGDRVDSVRFERLGVEGRTRLAAGDARAASDLFARALALWRGPVLTPVADKPFARLEAVRLDELRLTGLEGWVEAELALGHHADLVGRLEALTGEHPLRERLWAALMTALYRCDRRADALDAYARVRALLVEQLGLEPGERLRRLQTAILRDELAAARASAPRAQETRAPPPPLPLRLTSFVGRERELRELGELVGRARLVTLVGLGGAGKTRLALEAAACAPDACFVDLSALAGPAGAELVEQRIAVALNVEERSGGELGELLAEHVGPGASLLVLDNCEHVVDAVAAVAVDLLRRCRGLVILATSRRPLGVPGEMTFAVPPLSLPGEDGRGIDDCEAVTLFLDRARAVRPRLELTAPLRATVAAICRALDGLPLAIELAAARVDVLTLDEIAAHLGECFRFLRTTQRHAQTRHRTLRAAMDWSYELLRDDERAVLRELAMFAGGFDRAAVTTVCCDGDGERALDVLTRLAQASLVAVEENDGGMRYRLLETVRLYATDRLARAGGADALARRHADHYLALAESAEAELDGPCQERWLARLDREHDNLRAALRFSLGAAHDPATATAARIACALFGFWRVRGHYTEGRDWYARVLTADGGRLPAAQRARVLTAASALALLQCDYASAERLARESLVLQRERGDQPGILTTLRVLVSIARERGQYETALALQRQRLELARELRDERAIVGAQIDLAFVLWLHGELARAGKLAERTLYRARGLDEPALVTACLLSVGAAALHRGQPLAARAACDEAFAISERLGFEEGIAWAQDLLGTLALRAGDHCCAADQLGASLTGHLELGDRWRCASVLETVAALACDAGDPERSARLFGAAAALRDALETPVPPCERGARERYVTAARTACRPETWVREWAAGRRLSLRDAHRQALDVQPRPGELRRAG